MDSADVKAIEVPQFEALRELKGKSLKNWNGTQRNIWARWLTTVQEPKGTETNTSGCQNYICWDMENEVPQCHHHFFCFCVLVEKRRTAYKNVDEAFQNSDFLKDLKAKSDKNREK